MITDREWHGLEVEAGVGYDALGPVATARQMTGGGQGQPPGTWGICGGPTGAQRSDKRPDALSYQDLAEGLYRTEWKAIQPRGPTGRPRKEKRPDALREAIREVHAMTRDQGEVMQEGPQTLEEVWRLHDHAPQWNRLTTWVNRGLATGDLTQDAWGTIRIVPRGTEGMVEA